MPCLWVIVAIVVIIEFGVLPPVIIVQAEFEAKVLLLLSDLRVGLQLLLLQSSQHPF